jgi:membrane-bound serine protease (ClpP class)
MNILDPLGWAVVWMLVGCALLALEVFIPSGGLLSFLATVALLGSIYMAFSRDSTTGMFFIAGALFAAPLVIGLAFKIWPLTPMGRAFLGTPLTEDQVKQDDPRRSLVGKQGVARTKMLPSGAVVVDGQAIDAVSQGAAIEPGQRVVVQEVRGNRVLVRPLRPDELAARPAAAPGLSTPLEDLGIESLDDPLA